MSKPPALVSIATVGVIVVILSGVPRKSPPEQITILPEVQPVAAAKIKEPEVPAVKPWTIASSPHARVPVERINTVLTHLQNKGMTKQGAAYLTGNFIAESYIEYDNCNGDGGTACGLAQWRFGRQQGMPMEGLIEQLDWAVDVEMNRDANAGGYRSLRDILFDPASTPELLLQGIKNWERYGVEGGRALYAKKVMEEL